MANQALLEKLRKSSTIKMADVVSESPFFNDKDSIPFSIPMLNVAFSGDPDIGFVPGLTTWAGPSKHFKTMFSLLQAKAYMDKYPDAILLFYDSEFGTPKAYFQSLGIDMGRVFHTPITDVEQLKFDIMNQLQNIQRGDHVFILVDSVGNLASKKEVEDALAEKSTADMTRAKQLKSLGRMVTPHLTIKNIPMTVVNHTYKTLEMFSKDVVGGGTGIYYSSDNIFILGRQQDKEGQGAEAELNGWKFIINIEKSRYVREKTKIPIVVDFESGISKYSGLLDLAIELSIVVKPKNGWYQIAGEEKLWRRADTNSEAFWGPVFKNTDFKARIREQYQLGTGAMIQYDDASDTEADE